MRMCPDWMAHTMPFSSTLCLPGENMPIQGSGHLSDSGLSLAREIQVEYEIQFSYLESIIQMIRNKTNSLAIENQFSEKGMQQIVSLVLITRLLEVSEASLVIQKYGMSNEANSLFRVFLDAYFIFANVCSDAKFVSNYFKTDEIARLKLLNSVAQHDTELFARVNEYATEALKSDLKERIAVESINAFSSYEFAKNVGCAEIYDSIFRVTSSSIHTTPRSLALYIEEGNNGEIVQIKDHPKNTNIVERCYDVSFFLTKCLGGLKDIFPEFVQVDTEQLVAELNSAHGKGT